MKRWTILIMVATSLALATAPAAAKPKTPDPPPPPERDNALPRTLGGGFGCPKITHNGLISKAFISTKGAENVHRERGLSPIRARPLNSSP